MIDYNSKIFISKVSVELQSIFISCAFKIWTKDTDGELRWSVYHKELNSSALLHRNNIAIESLISRFQMAENFPINWQSHLKSAPLATAAKLVCYNRLCKRS